MYFRYKFREIDNLNNDEKTMNYTEPAPKTAAERMKAYNERKKQKKNIWAKYRKSNINIEFYQASSKNSSTKK